MGEQHPHEQLSQPLSPSAANLTRRQFCDDLKFIFVESRHNFLSATNNKRLLFELVKSNLTHNNGPFLDTVEQTVCLLRVRFVHTESFVLHFVDCHRLSCRNRPCWPLKVSSFRFHHIASQTEKLCYRKNTLLLVLFFGASVALAELPFENPALDELSDEDREEITEELEEVENDPFFLEPPSGPPSPSPPPEVKFSLLFFC